ncbi:MAG: AMP-dependent synthetase/ligase [Candidatus Bruticola sp.]
MDILGDYPVNQSLLNWAQKAEITTLPQVFNKVAKECSSRPYLGCCDGKCFNFKTYGEVYQEVLYFASALLELGIERFQRVANFSVNRPEWPVVDFGSVFAGTIHVSMYPTLSTEEMAYIVNDSEAKIIIASCKEQIKKVIEAINSGLLANVLHLVAMDHFEVGENELKKEVRFWNWNEFLSLGRDTLEINKPEIDKICQETKADDICSFVYTSGTTGNPKGAMLMHGNFVSQMESLAEAVSLCQDDVELSFLPLSHVFERICYYALTYSGSSIGYTRSIKCLPADLKILRPTVVPSVPRLFEKIFAKVVANSGGGLKDRLFHRAMKVGRAYREAQRKGSVPFLLKAEFSLFNSTVFAKIRQATGGRVRFFVSGGAPARTDVLNFFLDVNLCILEGYGLTETSPVLCLNLPNNINPGTVGEAVKGITIKVAEDGEICAKGPNIMRGYFKLPKETAEVFDEEGYFHTGDVGEYNESSKCYTITDRKKEILVLSNGKNVAPAPLENAIKSSDWIEQAVVVGNNRSFVGALIVPNFSKLESWASEQQINLSRSELTKDLRVEKIILKEIEKYCQSFSSYEKVRRIVILEREFKADEGEITPTLKIKRRIVNLHFNDLIEGMYARSGDEAFISKGEKATDKNI